MPSSSPSSSLLFLTLVSSLLLLLPSVNALSLSLSSSASSIQAGGTVNLTITSSSSSSSSRVAFFPFVNGTQWGAWGFVEDGSPALLTLPLPVVGTSTISVAVFSVSSDRPTPSITVGSSFTSFGSPVASSNPITVSVTPRAVRYRPDPSGSTVVLEWEPWFTPHNDRWTLGEAVPTVGWYGSLDRTVLLQHVMWFVDSGINALMVDHTNDAWGLSDFADRGQYAKELMTATTFTLDTLAEFRADGMDTPQMVMLLGLDNGASEPVGVLNEEIQWYTTNYLNNPKYADLLLQLDGQPLLLVFDGAGTAKDTGGISAPGWTIRYMSTQLQNRPTLGEKDGYWSWMDGSLSPVAANDGAGNPEAVTITNAFFGAGGWLGTDTSGHRGGATFLQELSHAMTVRPKFLVVCQWNEFNGQPNSASAWADSYNASLSNDFEPTSLTASGYPRPDTRRVGGWGFFYLNLLRAGLALYRGQESGAVVALSSPLQNDTVGGVVPLSWFILDGPGSQLASTSSPITVSVNGSVVATLPAGSTTYALDLSHATQGWTDITVTAVSAMAPSALSSYEFDGSAASASASASASVGVRVGAAPSLSVSVDTTPVGFFTLTSTPPYEYGPSLMLVNSTMHVWYCSPGSNGAWDFIRHSTSLDGQHWASPDVALKPGTKYDAESVCDPSVVRFRGTYFLYHTCISDSAPDGYDNNRVCVATADSPTGPWKHRGTPVVQDLTCPSNPKSAYCLGQPSAVVFNERVYLYYTLQRGGESGPNPGNVFVQVSSDGVTFSAGTASTPAYTQRDVDVKYDRASKLLIMVQGDVGSSTLTWSASADGETFLPYSTVPGRTIATNPSLPSGGSNNNAGLFGLPDGSFSTDTFVAFGSSYKVGWGDWHLYRTSMVVSASTSGAAGCGGCAPISCDFACSRVLRQPAHGTCAHPGSTNPGACCECSPAPPEPDCSRCAPTGCDAACPNGGFCAAPGSTDPTKCCACF